MEDLSTLDIQTLLIYRANAAKTGMSCMGHGKTARNDSLFGIYTEELHKRGRTEYGKDWDARLRASESGIFNGQGSS